MEGDLEGDGGNKQQREGSDRKTFSKSLNEKTSTEQND